MTQMLVRDLDPEVMERLKERARSNGRSLQKEVRAILEGAAEAYTMAEAREITGGGRNVLRDAGLAVAPS